VIVEHATEIGNTGQVGDSVDARSCSLDRTGWQR
jgi:hypothetical protein